jgi:hypothetical protein
VPVTWPTPGGPGTYTCAFRAVRKVTVTAAYRGDGDHLPSTAQKVTILPLAFLSRPAVTTPPLPNTQVYGHSLRVSGTLKPLHTSGTKAITIEVWRLPLNGEWERLCTLKVPVHTVKGASAYSAQVLKVMSFGSKYKICAVHADADHARTTSGFSRTVAGP